MRAKAKQTWAETLAANSQWSGTANRVYCALYKALVAELTDRGLRPADFGSVDPQHPDRWRHAVVRREPAHEFRPRGVLAVDPGFPRPRFSPRGLYGSRLDQD